MRISKPNIKSDKTRKKKISKYVSFIGSTPTFCSALPNKPIRHPRSELTRSA